MEHPFTPADQLPVAKIAQAWSAVHDRIYIWDYHVNFSHYFAPMPNIDVIAANIRFWVKNKAEGVMLQAAYNTIAAARSAQKLGDGQTAVGSDAR